MMHHEMPKETDQTLHSDVAETRVYVEHQWKRLLESWEMQQNPFRIRSRQRLASFLFSLNWQEKLRFIKGYFTYLLYSNKKCSPIPVIKAAMKKPELRQLSPHTSLTRLCFSRTTDYPFTNDCPMIEPQENGSYRVYMPVTREVIGEGTAEQAVEMVIKHLPPNCGTAVKGTADDFVNS